MNHNMQILSISGAILLLLGGCSSSSQLSVSETQRLVEQLEAAECGQSSESFADAEENLSNAEESLTAHLAGNPEDVEALILAARVGRMKEIFEPLTVEPGQEVPTTTERIATAESNLDQVLAIQPENAEAHYWKARLFGCRRPVVRDGVVSYSTVDLQRAVQCAQTAVELEPTNTTYRATLALYLLSGESFSEALDLLREAPGTDHPYYQLASDFSDFPVPDGAVFLADESDTFARQQMARGQISDNPQWRVRIYGVAMTAPEVETFFRAHWPAFKLFKQNQSGLFTQFLSQSERGFKPTTFANQVPMTSSTQPGFLLRVVEVNNPPSDKWEKIASRGSASTGSDNSVCFIYLLNCRPSA